MPGLLMQNWVFLPRCPKVLCWVGRWGLAGGDPGRGEKGPNLALGSLSRSATRQNSHALEWTGMGAAA